MPAIEVDSSVLGSFIQRQTLATVDFAKKLLKKKKILRTIDEIAVEFDMTATEIKVYIKEMWNSSKYVMTRTQGNNKKYKLTEIKGSLLNHDKLWNVALGAKKRQ